MARTKKKRSQSSDGGTPSGTTRLRPPKKRMRLLFKLLIDLPHGAESALRTVELPEDDSQRRLVMFDAAVLLRASNALKAVRLLCEEAHWEFAAPILRQLFELVVNMEYLGKQPDRGSAIFRYSKYGLLQEVQRQYLTLLYDQKTGRTIDTTRLATLERMLAQSFPEFRRVTTQGKVHWLPSWSGHTARYLAEQSAHRLRVDQYELLFSAWSEQAHAAPAALLDNMFPRPAEEILASEDPEVIQTVIMAVTFFLEVWAFLPNVPQAEAAQRLDWINAAIAEARRHGAPFPDAIGNP